MEKAMGRLHIFHTGIFMELTFLSTATALCSLFITMNVMQKKKKNLFFFFATVFAFTTTAESISAQVSCWTLTD